MPNIINSSRYDGGGNVTLLSTGTNRCLVILPGSRTGGSSGTLSVTVGGVVGVQKDNIYNGLYGNRARIGVFYILDANYPAAGAHAVVNTWEVAASDDMGIVLEFNDVDQIDPMGSISRTLTANTASTVNTSVNLASESGKFGIIFGIFGGGSFGNDSGSITSSDGHTLVEDTLEAATTDNTRIAVFSDAVIAGDPEAYGVDFSLRGAALNIDSMITGAFAMNAPVTTLKTGTVDLSLWVAGSGNIVRGNDKTGSL